jgi:hypothetical protein
VSSQDQKHFLVLFLAPASVLEAWAQTDAGERQVAELAMREAWDRWMSKHAAMIRSTEAAGQTRRVTAEGVFDARNDVMLYSIVEAPSLQAASEAFQSHPHLMIPSSSIEVTEVRPMG